MTIRAMEGGGLAMRFKNRVEAGRILAQSLGEFAAREDVLVLGLPRGGVPVAFEVAKALHAPLDVIPVRKLGVPGQEELAMGAIASGGPYVINEEVVRELGISAATIESTAKWEARELKRRERLYRGNRSALELHGRTVILVDDGLATGATMRAAVFAVRSLGAESIVVAVPIAGVSACELFTDPVERVRCVCAECVAAFFAVGMWYEDFSQTTDQEVCALLEHASGRKPTDAQNGNELDVLTQ